MPDIIILNPLSVLLPNQEFVTEKNCVSLQMSFNPTGGSFSISVLRDEVGLPPENYVITLPLGRYGSVKGRGKNLSSAGLIDSISGPALPLAATLQSFAAIFTNAGVFDPHVDGLSQASKFEIPVRWEARDFPLRQFNYRGTALQGIQQLASNIFSEVYVYRNTVYVLSPGQLIPDGEMFTFPKSDIVSASQIVDFSNNKNVIFNPAAVPISFEGLFVYDSLHAQKQPKTIVQAGAASSGDFIPIPDGWLIDGAYEEWTPTDPTDPLSNSNPSVPMQNGQPRYWKWFPSPNSAGKIRGIINFQRLVRQVTIPGNISKFIASPVTGDTKINPSNRFGIFGEGAQEGLYGFTADEALLNDAISHQQYKFNNAVVLTPGGSINSGYAAENFYTVQMEFWMFPKVQPIILAAGADPLNPFGLPKDAFLISPSPNIVWSQEYFDYILQQAKLTYSSRLRTNIQVLYRNALPQPGDRLIIPSLPIPDCGRINSVSLNFGAGGVTLSISAEVYNYQPDLSGVWNLEDQRMPPPLSHEV